MPTTYTETAHGGFRMGGIAPVPLTAFTLLVWSDITRTFAGGDMRIKWTTPFPAGTWYQIYEDHTLVKWTTETAVNIAMPAESVSISIAAVPPSMAQTDFSDRLTSIPQHKIQLMWTGGAYLGPAMAGFNIYLGSAPGQAVDYSKIVATIPVYAGNVALDGYGRGGYGAGGYGSSATTYEWTSEPVTPGVWNVGVKSVDTYGNESTLIATTSVTVPGPPGPPGLFSDSLRLHYTYDPATHKVTLIWNPSASEASGSIDA